MSKITLSIPTTKPYYADTVELDHIGWHPKKKQVSVRFTVGYYDELLAWHETADKHLVLENKTAVMDTDGTTVKTPADPQYDNLTTLLNATDLNVTPLEKLMLVNVGLPVFTGTVVD